MKMNNDFNYLSCRPRHHRMKFNYSEINCFDTHWCVMRMVLLGRHGEAISLWMNY